MTTESSIVLRTRQSFHELDVLHKIHRDLLLLTIFLDNYYGDQEYVFIDKKAFNFILKIIFNSVYSEYIYTNIIIKKYIRMIVIEKTGDTIFSYCLRQEKIFYGRQLVKIIQFDDSYFDIKNKKNITAFMTAISLNKIEIVNYLLKKKINLNLIFDDEPGIKISMLHFLVFNNFIEMLELLVKHQDLLNLKKIINLKNSKGQSALFLACLENNQECIKLLLKIKKIDVNQELFTNDLEDITLDSNLEGYTTFLYMCYTNNLEIVKLLLKRKFRTNFNIEINNYSRFRESGIAIACQFGLIKYNDFNEYSSIIIKEQMVPVQYCSLKYNDKISNPLLELLLKHREIEHSNFLSYTIFFVLKSKYLIDLLLNHPNFDINNARLRTHPHNSLIIYCVENNSIELVEKFLLDPRMNINGVNYINDQGNSALKIASMKGNLKIVKLLLLFPGIDVSYIKEYDGSSALSDAKYYLNRQRDLYSERYNNFIEIIKLLEEKLINILAK